MAGVAPAYGPRSASLRRPAVAPSRAAAGRGLDPAPRAAGRVHPASQPERPLRTPSTSS